MKTAVDNLRELIKHKGKKRVLVLYQELHQELVQVIRANFGRNNIKTSELQTDNLSIPEEEILSKIGDFNHEDAVIINFYVFRFKEENEELIRRRNFLFNLVKGERPIVDLNNYLLFRDVDEEIFRNGFKYSQLRIREIGRRLIDRIGDSKVMRVSSIHGTDVEIGLDLERYPWVNYSGLERNDYEMPAGEINTFSRNVNGKIVLVGAMLGTIPIGRKYGLIREGVLEVHIEHGKVQVINSRNGDLQKDLEFCFGQDEYTSQVSEVAIGTNIGLNRLYGLDYNCDERFPGFHIGFGATLSEQPVSRMTPHHLDFILKGSTIKFDGNRVMQNGKFREDLL